MKGIPDGIFESSLELDFRKKAGSRCGPSTLAFSRLCPAWL